MEVKLLSQNDPRWSSKKLGFSTKSIGTDGCLLTCVTMLLNYVGYSETPQTVNDNLKSLGEYHATKNPNGAFLGALLVWANVQRKYPKIKFVWRGWNYENHKVWWQINVKHMPVPVQVNAAKIKGYRHWVLFTGNYKCADPWNGKLISTGFYVPLTGYGLYDKV